jgi:hypothetical protein
MRLTLQQAKLADQRRVVGDADGAAREQRQRLEIELGLAPLGGLVGDAVLRELRDRPLGGVAVARDLGDAIILT